MGNLLYGLEVAAIGMIVVFAGLIILIALIKIMTTMGDRAEAKKHIEVPVPPKAAPVPAPVPVAPVPEPVAEQIAVNDESEIVAAIMAAITTMYEGTGKRPVVRAVRRTSKGWGSAFK